MRKISKSVLSIVAILFISDAAISAETEIVTVTAQKRQENIIDVPISVTKLGAEDLLKNTIRRGSDIQDFVPSLFISAEQTLTSAAYKIRGIGSSSQNYGTESSVGLYVDGVYRPRQSAMVGELLDIQSVEVLRGPQGTLFGKNTLAGAVIYTSTKPRHGISDGYIDLSLGNLDYRRISAASTLTPLKDTLSLRVAAFGTERDGYINVANASEDINDLNRYGYRATLFYTPSDTFSATLTYDQSKVNEVCCGAVVSKGALSPAEPSAGLSPDDVISSLGGDYYSGKNVKDRTSSMNTFPISQNDDSGASLQLQWDYGDTSIKSITAYREFDTYDQIDGDFTNVSMLTTTNDAQQESFSQEIVAVLNHDYGRFTFGGYFVRQELSLYHETAIEEFLSSYLLQLYGLDPFVGGFTALNIATGGLFPEAADPFPNGIAINHLSEQNHRSSAIFGQAEFDIADTVVLSVGLRHTREKKDMITRYSETDPDGSPHMFGDRVDLSSVGQATAGLQVLAVQLGAGDASLLTDAEFLSRFAPYLTPGWGAYLFDITSPREDIDTSLKDSKTTGSLKLVWKPSENRTLYGSFSTGYKSGGINTDRIGEVFEPEFKSETSSAVELGYKSVGDSHLAAINVFYSEIEDVQASTFTGVGFNLQNAGSLKSYGLEFEGTWVPVGGLTLDLNYSYLQSKYDDFEAGECWRAYTFHTGIADPGQRDSSDELFGACDRSGDRIEGTPKHKALLGVSKTVISGESLDGYVGGNYVYSSSYSLDGNGDPLKVQKSYSVVNLHAGLELKKYRTVILLWAKNVFNENIQQKAVDAPIQEGKILSFSSAPRAFGATVKVSF